MRRERYTHYPRTILWLVRGGALEREGEAAVEIAPFYLSKWPITNEQYEAFDPGHTRSPVAPGDRDSAVGISFEQARAYADWYAGVSRKSMRLPSELEWEYACRGEAQARYFWGEDAAAGDAWVWDAENSGGVLPPAEKTRPNDFGLHAMLGGVWEWTAQGTLRGGSFRSRRQALEAAQWAAPSSEVAPDEIGFRIARSFP